MGDAVAGGRPEGAISLHGFMEVDHAGALAAYVATLETFVRLEQLQELKGLARERTGTGPSRARRRLRVQDRAAPARPLGPAWRERRRGAGRGVGGFLGIGERNVAIPLDQIEMQGDRLTTAMTRTGSVRCSPTTRTATRSGTAPARSGAGCRTDPR
jgi:hypothetical protein